MKYGLFPSFPKALLVAALAVSAVAGTAKAQQSNSNELSAMLLMADGKRQRGFVQNSNENGVLFSLVQGAPGTGYRWETQAVAVAFDDSDEIMREARAAFLQGQYDAAAEQFSQIADQYVIAAYVPNNFATEARYYHIESLRLTGRWGEIAAALETPTAKTIPTKLTEFYQPQFKMNQLWSALGSGNLDPVKAEIESRQVPQTGSAKLLNSPAYREMPIRELVQITFMNAKVNEAAGETDKALADYYRTFSFTYGNDPVMADLSLKGALAIQSQNPAVQGEEPNPTALRQIQSLAFLYKNAFAKGSIDSAYEAFAVKPDLPKPPPPKEKEEGAAEEGAADAKPADDVAKTDDKKGDDKPKEEEKK